MKIWRIFAWIALICALITYSIGWVALIIKRDIWVPTQYWFYDAVAVGIFAVFFLIYSVHSGKGKK
ncbi:MAG TPA: hypothetical protein VJI46_01970 [Candidatus Nanoarchaeia archaeon]|nr:hypothetical protein [Candidatus Nanoarchaeia archaeon]